MIAFSLISLSLMMLGTSMVSALFGFLLAGVVASGKVHELYMRLDQAEVRASELALAVADLRDTLSTVLVALKSDGGKLLDQATILRAESILRTP